MELCVYKAQPNGNNKPQGKKWCIAADIKDSKGYGEASYHSIRWHYSKREWHISVNIGMDICALQYAAAGALDNNLQRNAFFPHFLQMVDKATHNDVLLSLTEDYKQNRQHENGEVLKISPDLWERNQQQQSLLLRYFALPLKEENNRLWLGVDSLSNLSACETIAFITGKPVETILVRKQPTQRTVTTTYLQPKCKWKNKRCLLIPVWCSLSA